MRRFTIWKMRGEAVEADFVDRLLYTDDLRPYDIVVRIDTSSM